MEKSAAHSIIASDTSIIHNNYAFACTICVRFHNRIYLSGKSIISLQMKSNTKVVRERAMINSAHEEKNWILFANISNLSNWVIIIFRIKNSLTFSFNFEWKTQRIELFELTHRWQNCLRCFECNPLRLTVCRLHCAKVVCVNLIFIHCWNWNRFFPVSDMRCPYVQR